MVIRIATWNVARPRPAQRARVERVISGVPADIWILTETHEDLSPGERYAAVSSGRTTDRDTFDDAERWVTIWSHFPMAPVATSDGQRTACALVTLPTGDRLIVYGSVLPWRGSSWRGVKAAGGGAFRAALDLQLGDWRQLQREYPDAALCVAGDLNQDLCSSSYYQSAACRTALRAALDAVGLHAPAAGRTDPVRALSAGQRASIDHICVPARTDVLRAGAWPQTPAPDERLSDHYGLWMDVRSGRD